MDFLHGKFPIQVELSGEWWSPVPAKKQTESYSSIKTSSAEQNLEMLKR